MSLPPLLKLTGSKATLHLLDPALDGETLTAQGYITSGTLKKGRVFRNGKDRYRLLQKLEPGTRAVPINLQEPVVLEAR